LLVEEYLDTSDERGLFRTYAAYRIGDSVFGHSVLQGVEWSVKNSNRLATPEAYEEDSAYYYGNPHRDLVAPLFELAGVDFGRVDYSLAGDRIQVWEINDNPQFVGPNPRRFSKEPKELVYIEALDALSEGLSPGLPIALDVFGEGMWESLQGETSV
jgi:hypothetical protein